MPRVHDALVLVLGLGLFCQGCTTGQYKRVPANRKSAPPALEEQVRYERFPELKRILGKQVDVNAKDWRVQTPLMRASASTYHPPVVEALLSAGADVNAKDKAGATALMLASRGGSRPALVKHLLSAGADVDALNNTGSTPLLYACGCPIDDHIEVITELLAKGADVNARNRFGETPLLAACRIVPEFITVYDKRKYPASYPDPDAHPLANTDPDGNLEVVEALLARGADINAKNKGGETALFKAAASGKLNTVRTLLAGRADINAKNKDGKTALMRVSEIIAWTRDPKRRDPKLRCLSERQTTVQKRVDDNLVEIEKLLKSHGQNPTPMSDRPTKKPLKK